MKTIEFEWWHAEKSSGAEVYENGELRCVMYACDLPDLTSDMPGFWSLDLPRFDLAADDMVLDPHLMGRAADKASAIVEAEKAARRFCHGGVELVE